MGSNPVTCTKRNDRVLEALSFCFIRVVGFEGEAEVNDSLNGCQSRGRPSAQFARESNPVTCTNNIGTTLVVVPFLFIKVVGFEIGRKMRSILSEGPNS